ncbi:hypothetical protein [Nitrosomonas communis]|uniref:hypothetical protein n=1 Tax=Nitrosomonas communis TaxID=44574 RepID=UPI003D289701
MFMNTFYPTFTPAVRSPSWSSVERPEPATVTHFTGWRWHRSLRDAPAAAVMVPVNTTGLRAPFKTMAQGLIPERHEQAIGK